MFPRKRLHPERVVLILGVVMVLLTCGAGLAGILTGDKRFFSWMRYAILLGFAIMATPMLAFLIGLAIEKLRGKRRD